jgi:broad specificity phosphatase PhoE
MEVYLVRHGESQGNAHGIHQDAQVGLSPRGIEDAGALADRLRHVPIDTIISSPFQRAFQTATIIARRASQHMLVVTHGQFMRLLVAVMTVGPTLPPEVFRERLSPSSSMGNGAITRCAYTGGRWELITWNDRSHLTGTRS